MKHYVLENEDARTTHSASIAPDRTRNIDIILSGEKAATSAELVVDFFQALNDIVEDYTYIVNTRTVAENPPGGPLYWSGRTAVFWGDIRKTWKFAGQEKAWISQVLNLSARSILVGDAVFLLARSARSDQTIASIHPNFAAAAQEAGLVDCGSALYRSTEDRVHSASTKLSALWLLSEFVSLDHGEHLADALRGYIGLTEPRPTCKSQLATRLVQRSGADPVVVQAIDEMLKNVEDPLTIPDLSRALGTSTRQLQRRFLGKTGVKLLTTYRELRLERAHSLLRYTDMTRREISTATGFSSVVSFGRAFRAQYNITPELVRNRRYAGELS
ncbi:helix-turn-helix domain-containing protein [Ruegeria sp.]|uniref:helix-turn-helix domain-containing protein n=1 Tax=Ruegeria sp. TaxID=1879320 RepID=UPI003C79B614